MEVRAEKKLIVKRSTTYSQSKKVSEASRAQLCSYVSPSQAHPVSSEELRGVAYGLCLLLFRTVLLDNPPPPDLPLMGALS